MMAPDTQILNFIRIRNMEPRDVVDVLLVAFIIYRILLLIKGTRVVQMTIAVVFLVVFYYTTKLAQLEMVQWIFTHLLTYIVFALIVLYSPEIRRALTNIGRNPLFRRFTAKIPIQFYEEIVLAATTLATKKIGGLIVIEGEVGLKNYIETGIKLDAMLTYDLLVTIFSPYTPLHDGAVIIQGNRIAAAACFLPLTLDPHLSKELGTRHRAAIGITEETDAVTIIVSEETGVISAVMGGKIFRHLDGIRLREILMNAIERK
jgi:uncharacterized protein (TIGR00159 family)